MAETKFANFTVGLSMILLQLPWEIWLWVFEGLSLKERVQFLTTHRHGKSTLLTNYLPELFPGLPPLHSPTIQWLLNHGYASSNLGQYFDFDTKKTKRTPLVLQQLTNVLGTPLDLSTWAFLARTSRQVVSRAVHLVELGIPCNHLEYLKTELLDKNQFNLIVQLIHAQFTYLDLIELKSRDLQMSGRLYSYLMDLIQSGKPIKSIVRNLGLHSRPIYYQNKTHLL